MQATRKNISETGVAPKGDNWQVCETGIDGCLELRCQQFRDVRGSFVKTFSRSSFAKLGLETDFVESFYTVSEARVLRGMHFQLPPADHAKLVYCISGEIMDVALDLRADSSTYGKCAVVALSEGSQNSLYLPRGLAHGFYVLRAPAVVMYHVTSEHAPALDAGVAWNSFGLEWPDQSPVLSQRDVGFAPFEDFVSPFRMKTVQEQL